MYQNFDAASQQLASLQAQLNTLQTKPITQPTTFPVYSEQPQQIKYVDGLEGAKKFQESLPPSSSAIVMDSEKDLFYFVMKDANGVAPKKMTIGEFTLHQEELPEDRFATKQDFEAFKDEIRKLFSEKRGESK